jgi:hypothetical protein
VPPVTTTIPDPIPTNCTASTLSPSLCPPKTPTTSPLLRLTTRTPPAAPPTTATVEAGLIAKDVIPPRSNRAVFDVSRKSGFGESVSQYISLLSPHAVRTCLPCPAQSQRTLISKRKYGLTIRREFTAVHSSCVSRKDLHRVARRDCHGKEDGVIHQRRSATTKKDLRCHNQTLESFAPASKRCPLGCQRNH